MSREEEKRERISGGPLDLVASMPGGATASATLSTSPASPSLVVPSRSSRPRPPPDDSPRHPFRALASLVAKMTALPLGALARQAWRRRRQTVALSGGAAKAVASKASAAARALAAATGITLVSWVLPSTWAIVDALSVAALVVPQISIGGNSSKSKLLSLASSTGRKLAPAAVARTVGGAALSAAAPDTARTLKMWNSFLPVYLRYRWTKHRWSSEVDRSRNGRIPLLPFGGGGQPWPEVEAAWDRRHEWGSPKVYEMLAGLSGYYVKAAQVLATRGDFVPRQWIPLLSRMFDSMDPRPWGEVRRDVEAGLEASPLGRAERARAEAEADEGDESDRRSLALRLFPLAVPARRWLRRRRARSSRVPLDSVFLRVNDRPLATASIAQVHCAVLDPEFRASLGWRWPASEGLGPDVVLKVQNQAMRGLMDSDVRNLGRLAAFVGDMMPFDVGGLLSEMRQTVPKEFDFIREARLQSALRSRLHASGFGGKIVVPRPLLAACSRTLLVMEKLDGLPLSAVLRDGAGGEPARVAAREGVATLIRAYGPMIFRGGLFHADPHSGQVLLMRGGAVGLLDYGQVKALSARRRRGLARIVIAVDDGDPDAIAEEMAAMGLMPGVDEGDGRESGCAPVDPLLAAMLATVVFDTTPLPAAAVNPLDDSGRSLLKLAPVRAFPSDMFQVGRTIMLLRGLCASLEMDVSAAREWRPHAEACLREGEDEARDVAREAKRLDNGDDDEHLDEDEEEEGDGEE